MAEAKFEYDVFISYSSKDKAWVRGELLPRLEASSLRVCIDYRDFRPGAPSVTEIERAVLTSRKTVLVLTPDYVASAWTEFETLMLQTLDPAARQRRIVPLLKVRVELPLRVSYLSYVDFSDPQDEALAWTRLLNALGTSDTPPSTSAVPAAPVVPDLQALRLKLIDRCSESDLRDVCFVMGIDSENYPKAKSDFARELLQDLKRKDRLAELMDVLRREKPWVLK
jgi:hypothetical protein